MRYLMRLRKNITVVVYAFQLNWKALGVLDLGSGSGRDCFILSKLVGESGSIVGVDMTDAQLAVANNNIEYHREKFGYRKTNVEFIKGNIDELELLNLQEESFDLIVSNCVINLTKDKQKVLNQVFRLLKKEEKCISLMFMQTGVCP